MASTLLVSTPAAAPSATSPTGHRIEIRAREGRLELIDRSTGDRFVPRGANLLMLVPEGNHVASGLFRPRDWDPQAVERELGRMQQLGYNTVRVFIDQCRVDCISTYHGTIRPAYVRNIARFLRIARSHGIVVMLASGNLPYRGYQPQVPCCDPFGGARNGLWLTSKGQDVFREYWVDVIRELKRQDAPLGDVFAYELQQEQFLEGDYPPLSFDSGTVTTADGQTYDMADPAERQAMMDSNTRLGARKVRSAIRRLDPGALVTMGFFAGFPEDTRLVPSKAMLQRSALDLYDLHLYPGIGQDMPTLVDALGLTDAVGKPVIMGEFGAILWAYTDPAAGADALVGWQAESCPFGFDGWLIWIWARKDDVVYGARQAHDTIARALSASQRPDPCS